jgi:hypothetical protein
MITSENFEEMAEVIRRFDEERVAAQKVRRRHR